jgi:galactonate dehydratase
MSAAGSSIEAVETFVVDGGWRSFVFVRVTTEDGLSGVGEATLEFYEDVVAVAVANLGRSIRGIDAARIEYIWQRLVRGGVWRGGAVHMSAVSGIDQALWDLLGKRTGLPVHALLGGACRDSVTLYGNGPRGETPEKIAASAWSIVEAGFGGLKFLSAGPSLAVDTGEAVNRTVAMAAAVRDAVGPKIGIAVDCHGRFSPAMAVKLARRLEPLDAWFLEEPVVGENPTGMARVSSSTTIPIAAGERLHSRWDFEPFLEAGAIALAQPDLAHCGGISEARRIAALVEMKGVGLAPHNPLSPVNTLASAHIALAMPNFVTLEYVVEDVPWRNALIDPPLDITGGILRVPDRPGLGFELDMETVAAHPGGPTERPRLDQIDGAVADW